MVLIKKPRILSKKNIEDEATEFLNQYSPGSLVKLDKIDLESIAEFKLGLKIEYQKLDKDGEILGMTIFKTGFVDVLDENNVHCMKKFEKGTIILNEILVLDIKSQGRYQFTLAHEIGHWILHRKEFLEDESQINLFDMDPIVERCNFVRCLNRDVIDSKLISTKLRSDIDWIEWQANYFGAAILMPRSLIKKMYVENCSTKGIRQIASDVAEICGVSKQAAEIRIKDTNDSKSMNNQISIIDFE